MMDAASTRLFYCVNSKMRYARADKIAAVVTWIRFVCVAHVQVLFPRRLDYAT